MQNVILVVHIIACIVMTIVIMLQKSEGGALGIGGGGGGLMTGRSAAGALVRVTMIFGGIFFITSLGLTTLANRTTDNRSTLERAVTESAPAAPGETIDLLNPTAPLGSSPTEDAPVENAEPAPVDGEVAVPEGASVPEEAPEPVDNPQ